MEEQQPIQQLAPQQNGRHPQPLLPIYAPTQENKTEEWDLQQVLTSSASPSSCNWECGDRDLYYRLVIDVNYSTQVRREVWAFG